MKRIRRIVEAAFIEGIGHVTAQELIALPEDRWGFWRDRITDRRQGKDGLIARCMACNDQVYIRTVRRRDSIGPMPLFAHYQVSDSFCPWYHNSNISVNALRATQYGGQQESIFHRRMCEQVAELVSLDSRYIEHTINEYLPPTQNSHGRFPDIYVRWKDFGDFAVEFQMSNTFQTEISSRCKHYEYEKIPLLWILFGVESDKDISQSIRDIMRRHRGNAFVLNVDAIEESRRQKTLILSCYLKNQNNQLDSPKLVRFDSLTNPRSFLPYHEDRIIKPLIEEIKQRRRPVFKQLETFKTDKEKYGYNGILDLGISITSLIAGSFSIAADARGTFYNFLDNQPNVRAMLNTCLSTGKFRPYADLLTRLIKNTSNANLLDGTVGEHLRRYRDVEQADEASPAWQWLRNLLPEALDPAIRSELEYFDSLPDWAKPPAG